MTNTIRNFDNDIEPNEHVAGVPEEGEKIVNLYYWNGEIIAYVRKDGSGTRLFHPSLDEFEAVDAVRELEPSDRIHMRHRVYGLWRSLKYYQHNPDDYIDDADIKIYIADKGYKNLTELNHGDYKTWELVHQRGLEGKVFPNTKSE